MYLWAKYGTQTDIRFGIVKRGVVDLAATADWTPATGDTKVSKDGGNYANSTNNPAAVGGTGSVGWKVTLSATELQCAELNLQIVDSATKAVEDQFLTVYTYGHASAKIQADLSDIVRLGLTALPNAAANAAGGLVISTAGGVDMDDLAADVDAAETAAAAIKVQTDKLAFTVTNQVDANVLDWKSSAAPAMTGDAFARLGAPAGASIAADIAEVEVETDDIASIKTQTDKLAFTIANQVDANVIDWKGSAAPAMTGDAFARLGAPAGASIAADLAEIEAETDGIATLTIKKNTALAKFEFFMVDSSDHFTGKTGLTVAVQVSIDGAAFGNATNTPATEVANGVYYIDLSAADLNGNVITIKATATGADATIVTIVTQP